MADVPHFDLPFRFAGGHAMVAEQDSLRDIQNCCEAILRTHAGTRETLPEFGVPDMTLQPIPVDDETLKSQLEEWEPRAAVLTEADLSRIRDDIEKISVNVSQRESSA